VTGTSGDRVVFSSVAAPGPAEVKRLAGWCADYFQSYAGVEITADWERPATIRLQYLQLGSFGLRVERAGPIRRFYRPRERVAHDGDDRFTLIVNRGSAASERVTASQSIPVAVGSSILFDRAEASAHLCPQGSDRLVLIVPRQSMLRALPNCEDLVGAVIPSGNPALRVLGCYADGLLDDQEPSDPVVLAHAGQSLLDLAVLAFGADRDRTEIARQRGLRAARLSAVLRRIRLDYADPEISPEVVAGRVGISTRYLHGLLQDTEASFSERVRDLRLAKAFTLLCAGRGAPCSVSDAAYEAGFSDLSYFNRSFRRKYGLTPTAARGRAAGR
jgi:AraC-like DNA-binding protein